MHRTAIMESRVRIGGPRAWVERGAAGGAVLVVAAILGFYVVRLLETLPIFAADAVPYLVHAIYPDEVAVRDPYLTNITNGTHLSLIRAAWRIGASSGASYMLIDKAANAAIYLAGLLGLWWTSVRRLGQRDQVVLLILALGFAYYRFPFSNMAEGPFAGALAGVLLITWAWYRPRPLVHALAAGVASAVLVLAKPHGVATVAALACVALLDAGLTREWGRLALRIGLFAIAFVGAGNLIQYAAQEPVSHPLAFFMSAFYEGALGQASPQRVGVLGAQALAISTFAAAVLAGTPVVLGLLELAQRWRVAGRALRLRSRDLVFLTLVLSLGATLAMVAIFAMKVASAPSETYRLWGRYFEFFAPMLWLVAGPVVARRPSRGAAIACGLVTLVGLSGLLALLQSGWIVMPWDSAVLTAFFAPDPVRAPLSVAAHCRAIAAGAALLAAIAYAFRATPVVVGCALTLTLSVVSTWLDHVWLGEFARHRAALELDLHSILPALPKDPARVVMISPDINVGHLAFLQLRGQPYVVVGDPAAPPPGALDGAASVIASGDKPPPGAWMAAYRGHEVSLWRPANASPLRMSR